MNTGSPTAILHDLAREISDGCSECRACQFHCAFLEEYGTPRQLADLLLTTGKGRARAFECSLCGLCEAVCPARLPLAEFFLAMRRAAMDTGRVSLVPYRSLLNYESVGASSLFRLVRVPAGGNTVFFPGCTFPGAHPETARALLGHLRTHVPDIGLVLGCCFKPSHDLGRQEYFLQRFGALRDELRAKGVKTVLTACPNCFKVFSEYGEELETKTVFDALEAWPVAQPSETRGTAVMHSPCPYRRQDAVRKTMRRLAAASGLEVEKTRHDGAASPCCGEGGAVAALRQDFSGRWAAKTAEYAKGRTVLTSCAGCAGFLSRHARTVHLLDLLFFPDRAMENRLPRPRGIARYMHRLLFKARAMLGRA